MSFSINCITPLPGIMISRYIRMLFFPPLSRLYRYTKSFLSNNIIGESNRVLMKIRSVNFLSSPCRRKRKINKGNYQFHVDHERWDSHRGLDDHYRVSRSDELMSQSMISRYPLPEEENRQANEKWAKRRFVRAAVERNVQVLPDFDSHSFDFENHETEPKYSRNESSKLRWSLTWIDLAARSCSSFSCSVSSSGNCWSGSMVTAAFYKTIIQTRFPRSPPNPYINLRFFMLWRWWFLNKNSHQN